MMWRFLLFYLIQMDDIVVVKLQKRKEVFKASRYKDNGICNIDVFMNLKRWWVFFFNYFFPF